MESNSVVVLNYKNVMCHNARSSIIDATMRWGVDYMEVHSVHRNYLTPSWNKIEMLYNLSKYDRILLLDADVLIRQDAPSPFELYPDNNKFYAVKDVLSKYSAEEAKAVIDYVQLPYLNILNTEIGISMSEEAYLSGFFNSGVCLFNIKNTIPMMDMFVKYTPTEEMVNRNTPLMPRDSMYGFAHHEQALMNYCSKLILNVDHMDDGWNSIDPNTDIGIMDCYIYHFTGKRCAELKKLIIGYDWKTIMPAQ